MFTSGLASNKICIVSAPISQVTCMARRLLFLAAFVDIQTCVKTCGPGHFDDCVYNKMYMDRHSDGLRDVHHLSVEAIWITIQSSRTLAWMAILTLSRMYLIPDPQLVLFSKYTHSYQASEKCQHSQSYLQNILHATQTINHAVTR